MNPNINLNKEKSGSQPKLAVLIDADNAQPSIIEGLLEEIAKYGVASVKRIYGDWTDTRLKGWKEVLLDFSIQPIQQFAYTTGKNATDSALIIDAMDMLYTEKMDGFCIVSSDSDFTRLSQRIRQEGLVVYGFGEKKTPKAFPAACDKFIYTEILRKKDSHASARTSEQELTKDKELMKLLLNVVEDSADDFGWVALSEVGRQIANKKADFDPRNYGYKKLVDLMKALKPFEVSDKETVVYVRIK